MELLFQAKSMLSVNIRKNVRSSANVHVVTLLVECVHMYMFAHVQDGWTGLHIAAHEGHKDIVESLLRAGAGVNFAVEVNKFRLGTTIFYGNVNLKFFAYELILKITYTCKCMTELIKGWYTHVCT